MLASDGEIDIAFASAFCSRQFWQQFSCCSKHDCLKNNGNMGSWTPCMRKCNLVIIKAIVARMLFAAHGMFGIWRVTLTYNDYRYWYLSITVLLFFIESVMSICMRAGAEMKWFSPCIFLYLSSVVPEVWLLELARVRGCAPEPWVCIKGDDVEEPKFGVTTTDMPVTSSTDTVMQYDEYFFNNQAESTTPGMNENQLAQLAMFASGPASMINKLMQQAMMVLLIIGRWLMPKGELTRDQLSQLLLVYIGVAADIVELFESFNEFSVLTNPLLVMTILLLWTWALMQFTLVLTTSKGRKNRMAFSSQAEVKEEPPLWECCEFCTVDIFSIFTTVAMQDGPFLGLRLTLIFGFGVVSQANVFFTCKNLLVVILQFYRVLVLFQGHREKKRKEHLEEMTAFAAFMSSRQAQVTQAEADIAASKNAAPVVVEKNGMSARRNRAIVSPA